MLRKCFLTPSTVWMGFLVVVFKMKLLNALLTQEKIRALEEAKIYPDFGRDYNHVVEVQVKFEKAKHIKVDFGNTIDLRSLPKEAPEIRWVAEVGNYYTVAVLNPDVPRNPPQPVETVYWLLLNVPGCWLPGGEVLIPYRPPENPKNEGEVHRVMFLVYHQLEGQMNLTDEPFMKPESSEAIRQTFRVKKFARKYDLMFPFAINFFRTAYVDPKSPINQQQHQKSQQNHQQQKPPPQQQQQQQQQQQKQQQHQKQQQQQKQQQHHNNQKQQQKQHQHPKTDQNSDESDEKTTIATLEETEKVTEMQYSWSNVYSPHLDRR